jgi:iron(III) transport system permease protein
MMRPGLLLRFWNFGVLGIVLVVPLAALAWAAFFGSGMTGLPEVHNLIGNRQLVLLGRSVLLASISGAVGVLLGLLAGGAVSIQPPKRQTRLALVMALPLVIPPFIHALSWILLGNWVGIALHGFWTAAITLGLSYWPIAGWLVWLGLSSSRSSCVEAARFGERRWHAVWQVELGLIRPHLASAFLLIAFFSFGDYGVPSLFRVNTYPVVVFSQFAAFYDLRAALLASWPYLFLPVVALWLWRRSVAPRLFETLGSNYRPEAGLERTRARLALMVTWVVIMFVSAGLPILSLLFGAGGGRNYLVAWQTAHSQMWMSLWLAVVAASFMGLVGLGLAWDIRRGRGLAKGVIEYAMLLSIALPGTIFGMAMIFLWNHPMTQFIYGSAAMLVMVWVTRFLPFVVLALTAGLAQAGNEMLDAARFGPLGMWTLGRRILLPLAIVPLVAGWAIGFVFSLHEISATLLVTPPGVEPLAVRIYSLYHYGAGALVAALSLFLVLGTLLTAGLALLICRWFRKS